MAQPTDPWTAFDYAVVDVEGNGQRPPDLVEISIVAIKGGSVGQPRSWLVRPPRPITPMARLCHRITDAQIIDAPALADIGAELRNHVSKEIGPVAKPDDIRFTEALPKTRSGKIMRRLLKQVAAGTEIKGDTTTLEDFGVLARLSSSEE